MESPNRSGVRVKSSKKPVEKIIEEKESVSEKEQEVREDVLTPPEKEVVKEVENEASYFSPHPYKPKVPFPQRIVKDKLEALFTEFVDMIKKLYVNMPFTEVLSQTPTYVKFLKEILSKKRIL